MKITKQQMQDAALDGIAVATSAVTYRGGEQRDDRQYASDLRGLLHGKSGMEIIALVASLGDLTQVVIAELAEVRGVSSEELLRDVALSVRQAVEESRDEE